MMRRIVYWMALLCAMPLAAQERTFRATPIDAEQNMRLDVIESDYSTFKAEAEQRIAELEAKVAEETQVIQTPITPPAMPADPVTGFVPTGPTVLMLTNGNCPHCDWWWNRYENELRSKGWKVEKRIGNFAGVNLYPTFRVFDRKSWKESFAGSMDMNDLRTLLGMQREQPKAVNIRIDDIVDIGEPAQKTIAVSSSVSVSGRYTTDELRALIRAKRPGGWNGPVYADVAPRSQAKQHLVGSQHGFSWDQVSGLTQDEALILHDLAPKHGNQIFPYRTGQATVSRSREVVVSRSGSGCPNGNCAKSSYRSRFLRR